MNQTPTDIGDNMGGLHPKGSEILPCILGNKQGDPAGRPYESW
jgi:hypothetical protein